MPLNDLSTARVLVAGATGGVGQLTVAQLIQQGITVRLLTRRPKLAQKLFGQNIDIVAGNTLEPATLPAAMAEVTHIICCTGTTVFPSERWQFPDSQSWQARWRIYRNPRNYGEIARNSPQKVDAIGIQNLVAAAPRDLKRFVFISSCGVLRRHDFPFNVLNAFGGLDAKWEGERAIATSTLPYTILRPGRLIDGPYTSYDLNTLLKAKTGGKLGVVITPGDALVADASRIDVAMACVQSLYYPETAGQAFSIVNQGPRPTVIDWANLFGALEQPGG